jgi:hypothetical protein
MPVHLLWGMTYDEVGGEVQRIIGDRLYAELVVLDRISGVLEEEDATPVGSIRVPIFITGILQAEETLLGQLTQVDVLQGRLQEEDPTMSDVRINMYLRDDRTLALTVAYDTAGTPVNLDGAKIWFTVKTKTSDEDTAAVIQKKNTAAGGSDTQIKIINAAGGSVEIYLVPADTDDVDPGIYVFDVQTTLSDGKTYTVLRGRIAFKEDVTKTQAT